MKRKVERKTYALPSQLQDLDPHSSWPQNEVTERNDLQVQFQLKTWNSLMPGNGRLVCWCLITKLLETEENPTRYVAHCVGIDTEAGRPAESLSLASLMTCLLFPSEEGERLSSPACFSICGFFHEEASQWLSRTTWWFSYAVASCNTSMCAPENKCFRSTCLLKYDYIQKGGAL